MSPGVRAFFGLPLPKNHRETLDLYIASCQAIAPEFRWVPAPNLHLTVRFIGVIERDLVAGIADRLAGTHLNAFELALGDLRTFKRGRLVRAAWPGMAAYVCAARSRVAT